jgi:hypothetical protein
MVSVQKPLLSSTVTQQPTGPMAWLIAMTKAFLFLVGISQPTPAEQRTTALGLCATMLAFAAVTAFAVMEIVRFVALGGVSVD